jgi:hypothetical protein
MNPRLPQSVVDKALAEDSNRAKAEFLCEWRSDLSDFVPEDAVTAATDFGVYERAPMPHVEYHCHCDAAGGTGADSLALAISHRDTSFTIDAVREFKPRFTPASAIAELATLVKSYRITKIFGDRYAIGFHSAEWKSHGVEFEACERTTSENYLTMLPLLLAGRIKLVDNVTLRNQLTSLERRPGDGAREQVSHPPNGHDDVACACAGAIVASMPGIASTASMMLIKPRCSVGLIQRRNRPRDRKPPVASISETTATARKIIGIRRPKRKTGVGNCTG